MRGFVGSVWGRFGWSGPVILISILYHVCVAERRVVGGPSARPSELLDPVDAHRRLTTRQVMELVGVKSKNTLWKRVKEGKLPRPRYQAERQPRWVLGEVVDALAVVEMNSITETRANALGAKRRVLERLGIR